jgi:hypothetical protein
VSTCDLHHLIIERKSPPPSHPRRRPHPIPPRSFATRGEDPLLSLDAPAVRNRDQSRPHASLVSCPTCAIAMVHPRLVDGCPAKVHQTHDPGARDFQLTVKSHKLCNLALSFAIFANQSLPLCVLRISRTLLQFNPCSLSKLPIHPIFLHKNPLALLYLCFSPNLFFKPLF